MSIPKPITLSQFNRLSLKDAIAHLEYVWDAQELHFIPRALKKAAERFSRSGSKTTFNFKTRDELLEAIFDPIDKAPEAEILHLFRGDAPLVGGAEEVKKMREVEQFEYHEAGLDKLTSEQKKVLDDLCEQYQKKFGFIAIVCAREHPYDDMISFLKMRLHRSREVEFKEALYQLKRVSRLRVLDVVLPDPPAKL